MSTHSKAEAGRLAAALQSFTQKPSAQVGPKLKQVGPSPDARKVQAPVKAIPSKLYVGTF